MAVVDDTHDPELESWVDSANHPGSEFPLQNLPLATFVHGDRQRIGVAIGDEVLDIGFWLSGSDLTGFFQLSASDRTLLRGELSRALRRDASRRELIPRRECRFLLPCRIGDYTDFYASIHHASNVGALFRPDRPLLPNYRYLPIAYHGRASSIVVSGTSVARPSGQLAEGRFGPSAELDYEVELAAFIGPGNAMGKPVPIAEADDYWAGLCLLNDWSARDIQRWEYQPLGPFLAKNFATTISPWLVTAEALAPFQFPASDEDRLELPYLRFSSNKGLDITVDAYLNSVRLSRAHFREMYWTWAQMIAHHTSNGCPLRPGDLFGSGTVSGPGKSNRGCLLELTCGGREPIKLPDGSPRVYLNDGDEITLRAYCERDGFRSIGFGTCTGTILAVTTA